ncbi:hypothetical protein HCC61_08145 [Streptomyces sp. HNM0575]|uniref:hypothetical protein n=1 Tax=Streptomyces sp. HNM0575 TaxID=2716338 RepID=UPI00145D5C21|nr:hypothetical protein [Streptomyces sp. HNM0575]NLU72642.1 hypothetical protein [Streptomyces sp. HNM0575]
MSDPDPRVEAMLKRDIASAVTFTCAMWLVLVFTFATVVTIAPGGALRVVLAVAMTVLGAFNTASMVALVRRYREHRVAIYGEDLRNLDLRRRKRVSS